jgi:hypothetical protein
MDPYLEDPQLWPGVHNALVVYIRDQLQPMLGRRYIAAVEERVFLEGPDRDVIPDVWLARRPWENGSCAVAVAEADEPVQVQVAELEIHESYVEILDRSSGLRVVTVIEVVSPSNKSPGPGRFSYQAKQREVRESQAHLVEIDLLRSGQHVLAVPEWAARRRADFDYLVCVNRATGLRDLFDLYFHKLRQRLPRIRIPLAAGDPDVVLDLQAVINQTYEAGRYRDRLRYDSACVPPLRHEDQQWANDLVARMADAPAPSGSQASQ